MSPLTLPHFEFSPYALCHAWPFLGGIGPFPPLLTHFVFFLVQCVAIPLSAPLSLYFTCFFFYCYIFKDFRFWRRLGSQPTKETAKLYLLLSAPQMVT